MNNKASEQRQNEQPNKWAKTEYVFKITPEKNLSRVQTENSQNENIQRLTKRVVNKTYNNRKIDVEIGKTSIQD